MLDKKRGGNTGNVQASQSVMGSTWPQTQLQFSPGRASPASPRDPLASRSPRVDKQPPSSARRSAASTVSVNSGAQSARGEQQGKQNMATRSRFKHEQDLPVDRPLAKHRGSFQAKSSGSDVASCIHLPAGITRTDFPHQLLGASMGSGKFSPAFAPPYRGLYASSDFRKTPSELGSMTNHEYKNVQDHVGEIMGSKFRHVRDAFRHYDEGNKGNIDRDGLRHVFRCYGYDRVTADKFFNRIDADKDGYIGSASFRDAFQSYIRPPCELKSYEGIVSTSKQHFNGHPLKHCSGLWMR